MTLVLFLGVLLGGIFLGVPVAFSLLLAALAMMAQLNMFSADIVTQALINGVDSFALLAIPFFLVAGEVMTAGGLSRRIVRLAMASVGHWPGGLGYVAVITAMVLAGLSGSAAADAAALIAILLPMMRQAGYPEGRSAGLLAAGGIIAAVLPPSVPLIIIGVAGNISISRLFLAGITPGLIMGLLLMLTWWFINMKAPLASSPKASRSERIEAWKDGIWAIAMPFIIIIGIRFGIVTPTEAAVVAAVYAIVVSAFIYRELTFKTFVAALVSAGRSTATIMFLVGTAMVAAWLMTIAQLPQQLTALLQPFIDNPKLLMLVIMALVLVVGMVMDLSPTILILVPLLMPVVREAGIDPVYFGIMFVLNTSISLLTPPVGTVLNVVCGVGRIRIEQASLGVLPFVLIYIGLLLLFVFVPEIITVPMNFFVGDVR